MELFREDGCLTEDGLRAVRDGGLDELGRLETAEHLSYCDSCLDRYTALLTSDALEAPPRTMRGMVMSTIWARLMQNTYGRIAVASVAAVLALSLWKTGALEQLPQLRSDLTTVLPTAQSQQAEPEPLSKIDEVVGKPVETRADRNDQSRLSAALTKFLDGVTHSTASTPNN